MNANVPLRPTIVDVYLALRQWWWLCLITFTIVVSAATAVAFTWTPTYRSTVLLGPSDIPGLDSGRSSPGALGALKSLTGGAQNNKSGEAIAILESAAFTRRFIRRYGLMPILFADNIDPKSGRWIGKPPALEDGVLRFSREVRGISTDDKTGFVKLTVDSKDPALAEKWANSIVQDLNAEMRNRAVAEARMDLSFLQRQIGEARVPEVRASLVGLVRERMETEMLAVNRPDYAFKVLDPAFRSKYHYQPRKSLIIGVGVLVGMLLSFGMVAIASTVQSLRQQLDHDALGDKVYPASTT